MPEVISHPPGTFCFVELATPDRDEAIAFYGGLFGWEAVGVPPLPEAGYFLLKLGGRDVGGLMPLRAQQMEKGTPSSWLAYVSVSNADASAERVEALGGALLAKPFDVGGIGRMCLAADPQGARFAMWQPTGHIRYARVGDAGSVCWNELATSDVRGAAAFYSGLFGWVADTRGTGGGGYTEWRSGRTIAGGMLEMSSEWKGVPARWMTYFAVDDCDVSASLAAELGGSVCVPPDDIPNVGRFAVIDDPGGATFSIFTPRLTA
jgi:predicted enzyme related to lactoylglutathione lyase